MMKSRISMWFTLGLLLLMAAIFYYRYGHKAPAPQPGVTPVLNPKEPATGGTDGNGAGVPSSRETFGGNTNHVVLVRPGQVLATVNGKAITLNDLIPLSATNTAEQEIAQEAHQYFLDRAINRELILQAAREQGIGLTESQEQQLMGMKEAREESEPGLVKKITVDEAQVAFELKDAEAFMLQNQLMAQIGAGADITPEQVEQYYREHPERYGELPSDPLARQQAWREIEYEIRTEQAPEVRKAFQRQLRQYLDSLKAKSDIIITPLPVVNPAIHDGRER